MTQYENELLNERQRTHGPAEATAIFFCDIVDIINRAPKRKFTSLQRMALYMNALKTARILSGDPNAIEHWDDLVGYPELARTELEARNG